LELHSPYVRFRTKGENVVTKVYFSCTHCEAVYETVQKRPGMPGRFNCNKCKMIVHQWGPAYNYVYWKLHEK